MAIREINPSTIGLKGGLLLTGFFKSCLEQHFFTPDGIFDDSLKETLWRADEHIEGTSNTKIYINHILEPHKEKSNFRPAILINRGEWKREKLAFGDASGGDQYYGQKTDRWHGSHTFTCLTKRVSTCEILGHEVATFFEVYGQLLAAQICLEELILNSISPVTLIGEDNETYSVTVTVSYKHYNRWSLEHMAPKIRHIRPVITVRDYDGRFAPKTTIVDLTAESGTSVIEP